MNRRKRTLAIIAVLVILLTALTCWPVYRQVQRQRKDQALIAAIKAVNEGRVRELLDEGASANAHDTGANPSFMQALRLFLSRWHRSNAPIKSPDQPSALALAVELPDNNERLALMLLDHGANPNDVIEETEISSGSNTFKLARTPVLTYTSGSGTSAVFRKLLEKGADPNAHDEAYWGRTPLMFADEDTARLLIAHGADVNAVDDRGATALMYAVYDGNIVTTRLLLEHGARVAMKDDKGATAMTMQVDAGSIDPEILALLRKYAAQQTPPATRDSHTHAGQAPEGRKSEDLLSRHGAK